MDIPIYCSRCLENEVEDYGIPCYECRWICPECEGLGGWVGVDNMDVDVCSTCKGSGRIDDGEALGEWETT